MYYINAVPNEAGNYGNPASNPHTGALALPDSLLSAYIAANGFVLLTVEDGAVTTVETNTEALEAYSAEHSDTPADPEPGAQDDTDAMLIDHEYRLTLLELGVAEGV